MFFFFLVDLSKKVNHRERERVQVEMDKKDEESLTTGNPYCKK